MDKVNRFWKRIPKGIRKTLVLIVGSTVILTGLIMVILPGPGWVVVFLGFAILATEFAFAEKARDWVINQVERLLKPLIRKIKKFLHLKA